MQFNIKKGATLYLGLIVLALVVLVAFQPVDNTPGLSLIWPDQDESPVILLSPLIELFVMLAPVVVGLLILWAILKRGF